MTSFIFIIQVTTVDITGFILPCQFYNISKILTQEKVSEKLTINTKTFESMKCFVHSSSSLATMEEREVEEPFVLNNKQLSISDELYSHFNQRPVAVNDGEEIKYHNGIYTF